MAGTNDRISRDIDGEDDLRLLPFALAGLVCFAVAVALGTGSWMMFGKRHSRPDTTAVTEQSPVQPLPEATPSGAIAAPPTPEESKPVAPAPALPPNVIAIPGAEIVLGGGETKQPIQRELVRDFAISATEVTNAEFAEFVRETGRTAPGRWKNGIVPAGEVDFPVTDVTFADAGEYCAWLGRRLQLPVRLPTEAEWELAARGTDGRRYPWGDEWNKEAAASEETGGKLSAVRSHPLNRSPFGVYDMAGSVWEWTAERVDRASVIDDPRARKALRDGTRLRVVKGGSAFEKSAQIGARSRYEIPEDAKNPWVGFRYVIEQKDP